MKIITAKASFIKASPRKLRLIANTVRGLTPQVAISRLKVFPHRAALAILKVYQQALGNAKTNFQISPADLTVASLQIHEGPRYKRQDAHAHGARFGGGVRHKKLAHVSLELKYGTES